MAATFFLIRGIEPPDLKLYPDSVKVRYWNWVAEIGLKVKDGELAKGLDKDGRPLRPIRLKTAEHRRSAMTPTGRGDPSAPPLMPGRSLSRTRSLLAARGRKNSAEFYWRFDPWTHESWGKILRYQADKGRDVFGLSRKATLAVQAQALKRWEAWKRTHGEPSRKSVVMPPAQPKSVPFVTPNTKVSVIGSTDARFMTFGAGQTAESFAKAVREGRTSGFMTHDQLVAHYRASIAKPRFGPGTSPAAKKGAERLHPRTGAAKGSTNRVIAATFGAADRGGPFPFTGSRTPPAPKPLRPKAWSPGDPPVRPGDPIAERIKAAVHLESKRREISGLKTELERLKAEYNDANKAVADFYVRAKGSDVDLGELSRLEKAVRAANLAVNSHEHDVLTKTFKRLNLSAGSVEQDWDHRIPAGPNPGRFDDAVQGAKEWMAGKLAKGQDGQIHVNWSVVPDDEAHRSYASRESHEIRLDRSKGRNVAIHEWGHQIEYHVPGVESVSNEFLRHRVGNETLVRLRDMFPDAGYRDDEFGRGDEFGKAFGERSKWYVGKDYGGNGTTEIVAMGLEQLCLDPIEFAINDPEFFKFILGILDGSLRLP